MELLRQVVRLKNDYSSHAFKICVFGCQERNSILTHAGNDHRVVGEKSGSLPLCLCAPQDGFIHWHKQQVKSQYSLYTSPVIGQRRKGLVLSRRR